MTAGEIKLGGRAFQLVNYQGITSLHEHYVMKLLSETGLDKVLPDDDLPPVEEVEAAVKNGSMKQAEADDIERQRAQANAEYMARLQQALVNSLRLHELLAAYMIPVGKTEADWSLDLASETAKFLQGLQSREDRDEIHRLSMVVVFDFFRAAVGSWQSSLNSLDQSAAIIENADANVRKGRSQIAAH